MCDSGPAVQKLIMDSMALTTIGNQLEMGQDRLDDVGTFVKNMEMLELPLDQHSTLAAADKLFVDSIKTLPYHLRSNFIFASDLGLVMALTQEFRKSDRLEKITDFDEILKFASRLTYVSHAAVDLGKGSKFQSFEEFRENYKAFCHDVATALLPQLSKHYEALNAEQNSGEGEGQGGDCKRQQQSLFATVEAMHTFLPMKEEEHATFAKFRGECQKTRQLKETKEVEPLLTEEEMKWWTNIREKTDKLKGSVPGWPLLPQLATASLESLTQELQCVQSIAVGQGYAELRDAWALARKQALTSFEKIFNKTMQSEVDAACKTARIILACQSGLVMQVFFCFGFSILI